MVPISSPDVQTDLAWSSYFNQISNLPIMHGISAFECTFNRLFLSAFMGIGMGTDTKCANNILAEIKDKINGSPEQFKQISVS